MGRSRGTLSVLMVVASLASSATAQTTRDRDPTAAEALFLAGRDAMKRGDYSTACAKFKESDRLDPATGTAANLADCQERLGRVAAAWASWKEAIELLPANDPRLAPMRDRASAIEKRVPRLLVHAAPTLPPDATMTRDDVEMTRAIFDTAIPEDPGAHTIVVKAPGHADRSYPIELKESQTTEVTIDVGDAVAPPPAPPPPEPKKIIDDGSRPPSRSGKMNRTIGYGLVSLGVAGVGVGMVTGIVAMGKKDDLQGNCFPANVCNADGASAARTGHAMALVSTVSFVVAGAALAGGAVLIFTAPKSRATIAVAPAVGAHDASLSLRSTF